MLRPDGAAWAEVRRTFSSVTRTPNLKDAPGHSPSLRTRDPSQRGWDGARKVLGTPRGCGRFSQGKENIHAISSGWPFCCAELFQHTARNENDNNSSVCSSCHHATTAQGTQGQALSPAGPKNPPFPLLWQHRSPCGPVTDQHQCSSHQDVTVSHLIPKPGTKHPAAPQRPAPASHRGLEALEGSGTPYCGRPCNYRGKSQHPSTLLPHPRRKEHSRAHSPLGLSCQLSLRRASRGRF